MLKANIRLSVVKGIRLDIVKLVTWLVEAFDILGLIFLFFVFAITSDETIQAVVINARTIKGKPPS